MREVGEGVSNPRRIQDEDNKKQGGETLGAGLLPLHFPGRRAASRPRRGRKGTVRQDPERLRGLLGVKLLTFCVRSNHYHACRRKPAWHGLAIALSLPRQPNRHPQTCDGDAPFLPL